MDESALQNQLDRIERRQSLLLSLIAIGYVLSGSWFLVEEVDAVTVWNAGVSLAMLAVAVSIGGMVRRRRSK